MFCLSLIFFVRFVLKRTEGLFSSVNVQIICAFFALIFMFSFTLLKLEIAASVEMKTKHTDNRLSGKMYFFQESRDDGVQLVLYANAALATFKKL